MSRSRILFLIVSVAILLPIAAGTLTRAAGAQAEEDSLYKHLSVFSEILSLIRRSYVDETSVEGLFAGALDGATDALDSMATYVPPAGTAAYRAAREVGTKRSGLWVVKDRGIAYVLAVAPGSPGATAGVQRGDILSRLGDQTTRELPLWKIRTTLAGEPGETLGIETLRRGQAIEAELTLGSFEPPAPALEEHEGISVLRVSEIGEATEGNVRELLTGLTDQRVDRLIVDLRGVAGGDQDAAYRLADLFVSGTLGELKGRDGTLVTFTGTRAPVWSGRLVLLTDRGSQGASEILASVLSQLAQAELVGDRTFGHAGRRKIVELSSGAELEFTDAFYTGPDGTLLNEGLVPEVRVTEASRTASESDVPVRDLILQRALELLQSDEADEKVA